MAVEIYFYHLTSTPLEKALAKLLEKIIAQNRRVLILTDGEDHTETVATQLWTYHPSSFLPHGTHKDGFEKEQPIFLTSQEENPNNAQVLIVLKGTIPKFIEKFDRVLDLFEDAETSKIEERWNAYEKKSFSLTYWSQKKDGSWEKTREKVS